MDFDLATGALVVHVAIGVVFLSSAALSVSGGNFVPAALQGIVAVLLFVLGVAVSRIIAGL